MSKIVKLFVEVYSCEGTRSACACWMLATKDGLEKKCAPRTEDVSEQKMADGMAITLLKSIPTSSPVEVFSTSEVILAAFQQEAAELGHELVATKTSTKENRWSKLCKTEAVYNAQLIQMGFWKGKKPLLPEFPKEPDEQEKEPEAPKAEKTFTEEEVSAMVAAQVAEKMAALEEKLKKLEASEASKTKASKTKASKAKASKAKEAPKTEASKDKAPEEDYSDAFNIDDSILNDEPSIPGLDGPLPI